MAHEGQGSGSDSGKNDGVIREPDEMGEGVTTSDDSERLERWTNAFGPHGLDWCSVDSRNVPRSEQIPGERCPFCRTLLPQVGMTTAPIPREPTAADPPETAPELPNIPFQGGRGLRFSLGPIGVTVHWSFAFVALFGLGAFSALELVGWVAAVFAGVMLHELGHAVLAVRYGAKPVTVTLFAFGGFTSFPGDDELAPGQRFVMTAAGSGVGILAGGALLAIGRTGAFAGMGALAFAAVSGFTFVSLFWGVLNWLPILPLDGGRMLFVVLDAVVPRVAERLSKAATVTVGAVAIGAALIVADDVTLAIFLFLIVSSGVRAPLRRARSGEDASGLEQRTDSLMVNGQPWRPDGEKRRGKKTAAVMAIGLVASYIVVAGVLWVFAHPVSDSSWQTLEAGDCFDTPSGDEFFTVKVVDCAKPHENEVFRVTELADGDWPGDLGMLTEVLTNCSGTFDIYVRSTGVDDRLEFDGLTPTEESWRLGTRTLVCFLYGWDESGIVQRTGRLRDSSG